MLKSAKKILLSVLVEYMTENGINTQNIKSANPFPVSPRWVDNLIKSVKDNDNTGFNKNLTIALLDFLIYPYEEDGNVLIIKTLTNEQIKKRKASLKRRANGKTERTAG